MKNKLFIPLAIIIAGLAIAGAVVFINCSSFQEDNSISLESAGQKVIAFVNEKLLQGQSTASLIDTVEENGLYKVKFNVEGEEVEWRITKDGKLVVPQVIDVDNFGDEKESAGTTIGNFSVDENSDINMEDGKPIVYFFGSESCSHCQWEHPIMQETAKKFEGYISFHDNMGTGADQDVFTKYSQDGYVPAIVIGGRYFRVGSGETSGEDQEMQILTALICKITDSQPDDICAGVQELINNI